jgi:hypothetical protein
MFYTFIVLFEKIKYSDRSYGSLQIFYYKRRKVTNLALTGWGCYRASLSKLIGEALIKGKNIRMVCS